MTNLKEYISGNFLSPEVLKELKTNKAVITGEPNINEDTPFGRDVLEMEVEVKGQKFVYTMNRTSARKVSEDYGTEAKEWIGKTLHFDIVKMNVKGQLKDVMYAKGETQNAPGEE